MPSLQIRKLPDDIYQTLAFRAEQSHRSLAQQALIDLRSASAGTNTGRRDRILEAISQDIADLGTRPPLVRPETVIREDRKR